MTNLECITQIMTFFRYGALAQAFVMDALSKHAEHIARMPLEQLQVSFGDHPMIGANAWQLVAKEIHEKLQSHFAR
jgi:hypothetical protein